MKQGIAGILKFLLISLIHFYQIFISPLLGNNCRYYPTCSQYAIEAIEKKGVIKGSWMAVKRICRCHPWHDGGHDPVK